MERSLTRIRPKIDQIFQRVIDKARKNLCNRSNTEYSLVLVLVDHTILGRVIVRGFEESGRVRRAISIPRGLNNKGLNGIVQAALFNVRI